MILFNCGRNDLEKEDNTPDGCGLTYRLFVWFFMREGERGREGGRERKKRERGRGKERERVGGRDRERGKEKQIDRQKVRMRNR